MQSNQHKVSIRAFLLISFIVFSFPIWIKWLLGWMVFGGEYIEGIIK